MEVEDAVRVAKAHVEKLFAAEGIDRFGLEEIEGSKDSTWQVTTGFSRNWDHSRCYRWQSVPNS